MMKLVKRSALILTFSPRRRNRVPTSFEHSQVDPVIDVDWTSFKTRPICQATGDDSPSPWGEGWGEGEPITQIP